MSSRSSPVSIWTAATTDTGSGKRNQDGSDDDVIPSADSIGRVFTHGKHAWRDLLARAGAMTMRRDMVKLSDLAHRWPAMPDDLQGIRELSGQATWQMRSSGSCCCCWMNPTTTTTPPSDATRTEQVHSWAPTVSRPTLCAMSDKGYFSFSDAKSNGISLLFFAWTYILCMKLLEKQRLAMCYTNGTSSIPRRDPGESGDGRIMMVDIGAASEAEVRWWRAILAPGQGWRPASGPQPVWAIFYTGNIKFNVISAGEELTAKHCTPSSLSSPPPPSSAEAAGFLARFTSMYNLQCQASLALAMALTLPLHGEVNSTVRLPRPFLVREGDDDSNSGSWSCPSNFTTIAQEYDNLSRYMTLSSMPTFMSSALWGVFWEPGVDCNLVSPWYDAILDVVRPLVDDGDLEILGHILALRRPNIAPLWYGILACGQTKVTRAIVRFLETLQTPMMLRPVPEVAVWTRSPQSFMDLGGSGPYIQETTDQRLVSRADVWRLRHECWDAEAEGLYFRNPPFSPWPPFGSIPVDELELPVVAHVECSRHIWYYSHWTWLLGDNEKTEMPSDNDAAGGNTWTADLDEIPPQTPLEQQLPLHLPPSGYIPNNVASKTAVGAIFRWSATEMEPSGKDIYAHHWVDALAGLDLWENDDKAENTATSSENREQGSLSQDLFKSIKDWAMHVVGEDEDVDGYPVP